MAKFEIYREDINKVLATIDKPAAEDALGAWASAAMIAGFLPMNNSATSYIGDNKWECKTATGKKFIVEARAV